MHDLVIRNGRLVTAADVYLADVGLDGDQIAAIGHNLAGRQVIDASGLWVLPGAVDPHVHLQMDAGVTQSSDDWETGTIAAACGGTTTVIDFVEPDLDAPLLPALAQRRAQAEGRAAIDYGLHMTLRSAEPHILAEVPAALAAGCPSFKTYLTYEGFHLEDEAFLKVLESVAEAEAIGRALALAEVAGCPLYVVHVSTARGAQAVQRARQRGQAAFGETCPQYLLLTDAEYQRPGFEGAKFVCSPPLRPPGNGPILWARLAAGGLQTIGTDHCPFFFQGQKTLGADAFTQIPNGLPGVEARLALLYTFGVGTGRLSLNRWVEVCCTAPARIFGLYPRKGALVPGADADLVLFDPEKEATLSTAILHEHVDYTPYDGLALRGYPVMTIARGQVIARDGQFVGGVGRGRFLQRRLA